MSEESLEQRTQDFHCYYCNGVWKGGRGGHYLGKLPDLRDNYASIDDVPSSGICDGEDCQRLYDEQMKEVEKMERKNPTQSFGR